MQSIPLDIATHKLEAPVQPKLAQFPSRQIGKGRARAFHSLWYSKYSSIEYSVSMDAAFCFPCRFYMHGNPKEDAFTHSGFRDWKHAMGQRGIISKHDISTLHKAAMANWNSYVIINERGTAIANQLQNSRQELVKSNQHCIKSLCDIIVFCAKQDLPLRGHRESDDSSNKGNFLEMLNVVAKHDAIIKEKLLSLPNNASYKSPEIQNTLLQVMGNLVRKAVCQEIQKASFFSLLVDETKDCSKKEQMSISFRYVDVDSATIIECFLTFLHAEKLDAESLTKYIIDTCNLHQLDPSQIVSQGYDGASVMSGVHSGVQARYAPNAIYIHCNAHCLNLCLVESVKAVKHARDFFALLEALYVFLTASKCHVLFLENRQENKFVIYNDCQTQDGHVEQMQ